MTQNSTPSYLDDLLDQSRALQATLDGLHNTPPLSDYSRKLRAGRYTRVILTGMGSSYHGLYPLQLSLFSLPLGVIRLETAELIHHARGLIKPENLIIVVSQSGESVEVVQLVEQAGKGVDLIGITNTAGSTLAEYSSSPVLTCAGEEMSVSCKTYISALAALCWVGDQLTGTQAYFSALTDVPQQVAEYWTGWQDSVAVLQEALKDIRHLYLLGRGSSLAAACAGALIIKEAARFSAEGMNSAAFRHGPIELISPSTFVLVYEGTDSTAGLNSKLTADVLAAGGKARAVGAGEGRPPFRLPVCQSYALPILEIMAAQMISLALAKMQGFEAGRFIHTSKVTTVE